MKRLIAVILCITLLLAGCSVVQSTEPTEPDSATDITDPDLLIAELNEYMIDENHFTDLNDPALLQYAEDQIYAELSAEFSSDDYTINNIVASYVSQEYLDEVAFNSQSNIFFGYTLAEIDAQFEGSRYVFTLGEDGQTDVQEMQIIEDTTVNDVIKNVAIGTGVIMVCVTVSFLTAGSTVPVAVNLIFTAAAKTGAAFALSSSVLSGITAGITRAYQTGDVRQAFKAGVEQGSEAFKWNAIMGVLTGGATQAIAIARSTKVIPGWRDSEIYVNNQTKNAIEQASYFNGKKVSNSTLGATRPDVTIEYANGSVKAIEVKNYELASSKHRSSLLIELKRQITERIQHLPAGSTQEIVLDVRGRQYSTDFLEEVVALIKNYLNSIYPDIPVQVLRY